MKPTARQEDAALRLSRAMQDLDEPRIKALARALDYNLAQLKEDIPALLAVVVEATKEEPDPLELIEPEYKPLW